ncbi:aldo/keto reductase [Streptomyces sp. NPDC088766]|uniref:aldo/keto reductase n=1 Tax=Streptomyces sp. NPDC088766 TaxID=3365893 RepID=UPI00381101BF
MRYTTLGRAGPEVGVVGLGCMGMSSGMSFGYDRKASRDDATSIAVIHRALELGVTLIDTADVYGPYTNEEMVGRALAGGRRKDAVLATKAGLALTAPDGGSGTSPGAVPDGRPEHIRASIDASLRRLGTDHVDLYQLHRVDPRVPLEETWGAMAEVVAAGKARCIGLSEVTVEQVERARSVHPVASVQSELSLWTRDPLTAMLPYCEEQGIAFLPFAPLGRGFLTGRFSSFDDLPEDDLRRRLPRFQREALRANLAIVGRVREIAGRAGTTLAQVALAWLLEQGRYVVPIPGTRTAEHLADNAGAADVKLGPGDFADLDALPAPEGDRY